MYKLRKSEVFQSVIAVSEFSYIFKANILDMDMVVNMISGEFLFGMGMGLIRAGRKWMWDKQKAGRYGEPPEPLESRRAQVQSDRN